MAKGRKTGGRKPGIPNKLTTDVRELILSALTAAGGKKYLTTQAKENPAAFMALVGRCLPKDVNLKATVSLEHLIAASRESSGG